MKTNQKGFSKILLFLLGLIIIISGIYFLKTTNNKINIKEGREEIETISKNVKDSTVGNCGLSISSHKPNDVVNWPIIINGKVSTPQSNEDCIWQTFENVSGNARLYIYENQTWKPVGQPVIFNPIFSLNFNYPEIGLQMNNPIKIVFTEENVSAKRPSLIFELPLILK